MTSAVVGGKWSASRPGRSTPGEKAPGTHGIGGWVSPRTGLDELERRRILPLPELELRSLGRSARSQSLYRLRCPYSHQERNTLTHQCTHILTPCSLNNWFIPRSLSNSLRNRNQFPLVLSRRSLPCISEHSFRSTHSRTPKMGAADYSKTLPNYMTSDPEYRNLYTGR
jgi:hypothetical protein